MNYEFKGTKGSWYTESEYDTKYKQESISISSEQGINGLATIWSGGYISQCTHADAILISRAPELLEELKHCVEALEVFNTEGTRLITNRVKHLLKDATTLPNG